jgi:uncharacterized membrane protein
VANKNKHVIIAYFANPSAAEQVAHRIRDWDKANDDIKLGGIGILIEQDGKIKTRKVGARATGTGAKWGLALGAATGILSGGVTLVGGALAGVVGGAALGALFHKSLGLSDDDWMRLEARLKEGRAALIIMGDEHEVEPTQLELKSLGGEVENFQVPEETMTQMEAAEDVVLIDPDAALVDVLEEDIKAAEVDIAEANLVETKAGVVNVPGTWQAAYDAQCAQWDPACCSTYLTEQIDGTFSGTFNVPAGNYEVKVALHGSWDENYGQNGVQGGANYAFEVTESETITFTYDPQSHLLTIA